MDRAKDTPLELRPDGWDRFVRAVKIAGKTKPMHKEAKPAKPAPKRKAKPAR